MNVLSYIKIPNIDGCTNVPGLEFSNLKPTFGPMLLLTRGRRHQATRQFEARRVCQLRHKPI